MSFLEFPIKRYQFTLVAFAMLVALGISSYMSIPRQEDPYFPIPIYQIVIAYPGAEPQDVERLVAKPIEDRLSELDDVKKIESHSNDGVAVMPYIDDVKLASELNAAGLPGIRFVPVRFTPAAPVSAER